MIELSDYLALHPIVSLVAWLAFGLLGSTILTIINWYNHEDFTLSDLKSFTIGIFIGPLMLIMVIIMSYMEYMDKPHSLRHKIIIKGRKSARVLKSLKDNADCE